jgi:hypothetical protein
VINPWRDFRFANRGGWSQALAAVRGGLKGWEGRALHWVMATSGSRVKGKYVDYMVTCGLGGFARLLLLPAHSVSYVLWYMILVLWHAWHAMGIAPVSGVSMLAALVYQGALCKGELTPGSPAALACSAATG